MRLPINFHVFYLLHCFMWQEKYSIVVTFFKLCLDTTRLIQEFQAPGRAGTKPLKVFPTGQNIHIASYVVLKPWKVRYVFYH